MHTTNHPTQIQCQYYLSCYSSDFDQTLPLVFLAFTQHSFVFKICFFNLGLGNFVGLKLLRTKFFVPKTFLLQNVTLHQIFLWTDIWFRPKLFFNPKFLLKQHFSLTQRFVDLNFLLETRFFGPYILLFLFAFLTIFLCFNMNLKTN